MLQYRSAALCSIAHVACGLAAKSHRRNRRGIGGGSCLASSAEAQLPRSHDVASSFVLLALDHPHSLRGTWASHAATESSRT